MKSLKEAALLPEWQDWHWQMRNRITDAETLSEWIPLSDERRAGIKAPRIPRTRFFFSAFLRKRNL